MASVEQLQWLELSAGEDLLVSTEDLREYYHCFIIEEQRILRNGLALKFRPSELRHLTCFSAALEKEQFVRPCLRTLAMGDSCAVGFGQESHLSVLLRSGAVKLEQMVTLSGRPPRAGVVGGLLIDDLAILERVPKHSGPEQHEAPSIMRRVHAAYSSANMPRHEGKSISGALRAEFWGGQLDGAEGVFRPAACRSVPLAGLLLRMVEGGRATPELLEVTAGSLVSIFQFRRRLMSLLDKIYSEPLGLPPRSVLQLSPALKDELLASAVHACAGLYRLSHAGGSVDCCQ